MGLLKNIYFYEGSESNRSNLAKCAVLMCVIAEVYYFFFGYHDPIWGLWVLVSFVASPLSAILVGLPVYIVFEPVNRLAGLIAAYASQRGRVVQIVGVVIFAPLSIGLFLLSCGIMYYIPLEILKKIFP